MAFEAALATLPPALVECLRSEGALAPDIFVQLAGTRQAAVDLLEGLDIVLGGEISDLAEDLVGLAAIAQAPARCVRKAVNNATGLDVTLALKSFRPPEESPRFPAASWCGSARGPKRLGAAPKWPSKVKRKELPEGASTARQAAERSERDKWVKAVAEIVIEARLPAADLLAGDGNQAGLLLGCVGQGRRVRTLKKRVTDWRKIRGYLLEAFGVLWPRSQLDFLEYLQV